MKIGKRKQIIFKDTKKSKQNTYLINDKYFIKTIDNSIKDRILKEIIKGITEIKQIIDSTAKQNKISVYNELRTLENAGIIKINRGNITILRSIKPDEKTIKENAHKHTTIKDNDTGNIKPLPKNKEVKII